MIAMVVIKLTANVAALMINANLTFSDATIPPKADPTIMDIASPEAITELVLAKSPAATSVTKPFSAGKKTELAEVNKAALKIINQTCSSLTTNKGSNAAPIRTRSVRIITVLRLNRSEKTPP